MHLTYTGGSRERLDKFLHASYPHLSRSQIQKFIEHNTIRVNNKEASIHHWLKQGDAIELSAEPAVPRREERKRNVAEPRIVEQHDSFVIIEKPAGLLMHPTALNETATLASWLMKRFPSVKTVGDDPIRPGIVHRLDRDVGGLVLVTLTQVAFEYFKGQFAAHTIVKKYRCLVHGSLPNEDGTISRPLERDKKSGRMVAQSGVDRGKEAVTLYTVIERYTNYTLLDIQIVTGRTHQIRAHLFSIGHSIVGDHLYQTRDVRKRKVPQELERPFLYAYFLSFDDLDGQKKNYALELPDEMQAFLKTLTPIR